MSGQMWTGIHKHALWSPCEMFAQFTKVAPLMQLPVTALAGTPGVTLLGSERSVLCSSLPRKFRVTQATNRSH